MSNQTLAVPFKVLWNVGSLASQAITSLELPWTKYIPVKPTPKQLAFLLLPVREAIYGGAAGGGKSIALLMAALQYIDRPNYAALILRRTFPELTKAGALMDVARDWLSGTGAMWRESSHQWRFPSGASLEFGYLQYEIDKYQYQSAEYQFIGFDELTEFLESQYRFLFSRLRRSARSEIPLRMRSASNPGGIGHDWVKQRFMVETDPERVFLPAKLPDNPYLDQAQYIASLENLDPVTREQLLNGDWSARQSGSKFKREWFEIVEAIPADCRKVRFWDCASTEAKTGKDPDWTAGCLLGKNSRNILFVLDMRRTRGTPGAIESLIKQTAELDGKSVSIRMEQEPGSSGVNMIDQYRRRVLMGWDFKGISSTGSKEIRANPVASQAEAGNIKLVRGAWINAFLDEIEAFPQGAHDDQVDALSGAFSELVSGRGYALEVE